MNEDLAHLLEECLKDGRRACWEAFIREAQPIIASSVLRALARSSLRSREVADDLVQDSFLKMCKNDFRVLRDFRSGDATALRVYLRTIATSVVMDYFRRQ